MNKINNDNTNLSHNSDSEFDMAYQLCSKDFTHNELIYMLKNGNIQQKQIAALKFDYIKNAVDVSVLLENLTGCDGKIREAVAMKIKSILSENINSRPLFAEQAADIFSKAALDINANICRLIVDCAYMLIDYTKFAEEYTNNIINYTIEALNELDKFIYKDKKYVINKQLFKLYWCLEALSEFYIYADAYTLENILKKTSQVSEYTIREKTAIIIKNSGKFREIEEFMINDENYYVKIALNHPSVL